MSYNINIERVGNGYVVTRPPDDEDSLESVMVIEIGDSGNEIIDELKAFEKLHYLLRTYFCVNNDKHNNIYMDLTVTKEGKVIE